MVLHTCKYQIFSRGTNAFSCPLITVFICTWERRKVIGTLIQYNTYAGLDVQHKAKVGGNNSSSISLWINHILKKLGHWQEVITARDIKQPFHHIVPIKQPPGGTGEENNTTKLLLKASSQMENCHHSFTLLPFLCTRYTCAEQRVCTFPGPSGSLILGSAFKAGAFFWRSSKERGSLFGKQ